MQYYNIHRQSTFKTAMTHHHHAPGHAHPPASVSPSILRLSAWERLSVAAVIIVVLWGAVAWAIS
jgi:hypothetical protein